MKMQDLNRAVKLVKERVLQTPRGEHVALNRPISDEGLALLTASIRRSPPKELVDWLTIHDGESGRVGLLGLGAHFLSSGEIGAMYLSLIRDGDVDEDNDFVMVNGPARTRTMSRYWIPFLQINNELACLDYDPMPDGEPGQVIFVDFSGSTVTVAHKSLLAMFEEIAGRI